MAHTRAWDETQPTDPSNANLIAQDIRQLRVDIRERMDDILSASSNWETGNPIALAESSVVDKNSQNLGNVMTGAIALDLSKYRVFQGSTANGVAITFSFSNVPSDNLIIVYLFFFLGTGGVTINWPAGTVWASATPPVMTGGKLQFIRLSSVDAGIHWIGQASVDLG